VAKEKEAIRATAMKTATLARQQVSPNQSPTFSKRTRNLVVKTTAVIVSTATTVTRVTITLQATLLTLLTQLLIMVLLMTNCFIPIQIMDIEKLHKKKLNGKQLEQQEATILTTTTAAAAAAALLDPVYDVNTVLVMEKSPDSEKVVVAMVAAEQREEGKQKIY